MSQIPAEKKISYYKMMQDKDAAIEAIEKALDIIKNESFHLTAHELSAPLENIVSATKLLYQIGYASSLVIIEES